jgi:hypothetical protein
MPTDRAIPRTDHLPPDLAELCEILARGIVRLRSRAAEENARAAGQKREVRLHSVPAQRRHANRTTRRDA